MNIRTLKCVFALVLLIVSRQAFSQNISGQRLVAIEQEMFNDSNRDFIVVDLLMDNIIQPEDKGTLRTDKQGVYYYNDNKLEEQLQQKYTARMGAFQKHIGEGMKFSFSMPVYVSEEDLLNPESNFRKPYYNQIKEVPRQKRLRAERTQRLAPVIGQMVNENIIDTVYEYQLLFDETGLYVNKKQLPPEIENKYIPLFREALRFRPDSKHYYYREEGGKPRK